ncbi:hypothetical protein Hanom_Chr09g00863751 [Helianthus anomalus]
MNTSNLTFHTLIFSYKFYIKPQDVLRIQVQEPANNKSIFLHTTIKCQKHLP